jgi:hypothetical protein
VGCANATGAQAKAAVAASQNRTRRAQREKREASVRWGGIINQQILIIT